MSDDEIPEFGGSATFDFDGNFRGAEVHVEIPGSSGGDPAQWEFHPHEDPELPPPPDLSFMPHPEPAFDPTDIMHAPVPDGWHRDNLGLMHPDLDIEPQPEPEFQLHMPEHHEPDHHPHLDVPELHLDPEFDGS